MVRFVRFYAVLAALLLFPVLNASAQDFSISDFLTLRSQYNENRPITANGVKKPTNWELEQMFGSRDNLLGELWRIGSTKASIRARIVAVRGIDSSWNLLCWIYDSIFAERFIESLKYEGYTDIYSTENKFEVSTVYRNSEYDQCVKVKRLHNTARFNQSEFQYVITLGDSYCHDKTNVYLCSGDDFDCGGRNRSNYTVSGGMIVGLYAVTDSLGDTLMTVNYQDGQREGECRKYRKDGSLFELSHYKNDLLNGEQAVFDEKGNKISSTQWSMGWNTQQWPDGSQTRRFIYNNHLGQWKDSLLYHYDAQGHCKEEEFYTIKYDGTPGHFSRKNYQSSTVADKSDTTIPVSATFASLLPIPEYPDELAWSYYIDATLVTDTLDSIASVKLNGVGDSILWGPTRNGWTEDFSYNALGQLTEREVRSYVRGRIECLRLYSGHKNPLPLLQSATFHGKTCSVRNRKGVTLAKGSVRGDRRHGKWQHFTDDKNHRVWREEYYTYGELDSILTQRLEYDTISSKWRRIYLSAHYTKGILNGPYELKDSAKRTLLKGEYTNGERNGEWIEANGADSVWTRNYTMGAKDGEQSLSINGFLAKRVHYTHNLLRDLSSFDTAGYHMSQYSLSYHDGDIICRHTEILGDTTWVKTWRIKHFESIKNLDYDNFDIWFSDALSLGNNKNIFSDGERIVHKTGDTSRIYARGVLLNDLHLGEWLFVDYNQEVRLRVFYDQHRGDLIRREYYTDLNNNPYSGSYWFSGSYINNPPIKDTGESRVISDGVRAHGLGSHTNH
jgi:antitoxin component YwqK of YwqJK toxin-antitoxin module